MIEKKIFPATVIKVIDSFRVVINRGSEHDISKGQRFLIYRLSEDELIDLDTGESLGYLEIVIGTGRVQHVQEQMATIESDKTKPGNKRVIEHDEPWLRTIGNETEIFQEPSIQLPFDSPAERDKAKPL